MGLNVLLVDDSKTVRDVITKTLRLADIPVDSLYQAENGREALDILGDKLVDLVFLDINMPVMTGTELVGKMQEDDLLEAVPVVVVSSAGCANRIRQLRSKGIRAYVRKPFTPEQLRNVVRNVLFEEAEHRSVSTVEDAFCDVLEKLAFAFAEPVAKDELPDCSGENVRVDVAFTGGMRGDLGIAVPRRLCDEMAANILGLEPDSVIESDQALDAVKEVASVVCGHVLTAVAGEEPVFDLSVPTARPLDEEGWVTLLDCDDCLAFMVDDSPVLVRFRASG